MIAVFLTLNFLQTFIPYNLLYASNNGPNAPEASGFEPVSATDMVNLSSGDMAYVLPLLEIDGFPVTLSYHAGIPMDMEASWVGLGWNLNTGSIARGVVANPDDWSNGRRLNLTYLNGHQDSYSVNVGVGIAKSAEVGVGLSWGPNKSLSGSVSASIGPMSASIDTNGNFSIGVGSGILKNKAFKGAFKKIESGEIFGKDDDSLFGASLSISGNINKGGISGNIGVGGSDKYISSSMGISISGQGVGASYSIGGNNNQKGSKGRGRGASVSMNSFSAGDFSYNSKGFYIPLQIGILSFGFGFNRTQITVKKAFSKHGYGLLYHNDLELYNDTNGNLGEANPDVLNQFSDYKKRNEYGDVYEQVLPQPEEEFIGDYRNQIEKLNFAFAGYDSYDINATGIGGTLRPIVGENTALIGEGYDGKTIRNNGKEKTKVFYHHGGQNLKQTKSIANQNLHFVFDGQITEDAKMNGALINNSTGSNLNMGQFITKGTYSINGRPKAGSYVEVFTNSQLDADKSLMLTPASLFVDGVSDLSRISQGYVPEGIGGYKVTTPDGKTYHFSQPVYQYEQIQHNYLNFDGVSGASKYNSSTKREATPYATHWLLTAITGPDYIDTNNNHFADAADYGYWVRLDHGRWSNAFAWRSPYDNGDYTQGGTRRHYATFVDDEVEKADPGYFLQGRKDLYYLDKIVSKTQTAYFVKDIRYDGVGTNADYFFDVSSDGKSNIFEDQLSNENASNAKETLLYDKEYQLRLDKIVIVNNKTGTDVSYGTSGTLSGVQATIPVGDRYTPQGFFDQNLPGPSKTHQLHQSNNIIDVEDFQNFDYRKAVKVIKFNHNYLLAQHTPSSGWEGNNGIYPQNPNAGRLTLQSVKTYGRGLVDGATENQLYDYMPPYSFTYEKPNELHEENELQVILNSGFPAPFSGENQRKLIRAHKDNWGFRNLRRGTDADGDSQLDINTIDAWSLKSIKTPQGATIDIAYEEDDFYIEAFGRRFWENNLQIKIDNWEYINGNWVERDQMFVEFSKQDGVVYDINFSDYFNPGERVFLDLWMCVRTRDVFNNSDTGIINIRPEDLCIVESVDQNKVIVKLNRVDGVTLTGDEQGVFNNRIFDKAGKGTNGYRPMPRGECFDNPQGGLGGDSFLHTMTYKLLSNKVAPGTSGGGLRVKKITVNNNEGHHYITSYNYDNPVTGKTSGITSFNPVQGEVFVPYQNELPGPGVMYEWVTMSASSIDNNGAENLLSSIRYHYYTLKPVFDIFNPNIDMKDIDGKSIFKTTVFDNTMTLDSLTAKNMFIEKNLSKIGQLISTEEFNAVGQLMNKSKNTYVERVGALSETFSSMKSVFDLDEDSNGDEISSSSTLQHHYLALATKTEKVSVVKRIDNNAGGIKSSVLYDKPDDFLGTYTTSIRTMADGTMIKEEKFPAYTKYPDMGSKIIDPNNKNMLTQEAMSVTSVTNEKDANGDPMNWKTINANITTWNNDWTYRDDIGTEVSPTINSEKIWRKHKSFVWKDAVDTNGTFGQELTNNDFNWGIGATQTNTQWQEISEITRYTHWSTPIETKDINGNYASSKMSDNFTKTVAGGNARYTELFYSGGEYAGNGGRDGEVTVEGSRVTTKAHTGKYSLGVQYQGAALTVLLKANEHRAGTYKISVWAEKANADNARIVTGGLNGQLEQFNGEKITAGNWVLLNHYVELSSNLESVFLTSASGTVYFDDFRMHPVFASMNSYVYDQDTDQLTYILDANNMATQFRYDDAGRLCKIYKEVFDTNEFVGGFKVTNKYKYNYKDIPISSCQCCDDEIIDFKPLAVNDNVSMAQGTNKIIDVTNNDNFGGDGPASHAISIASQPNNGTVSIDDAGTPTNPIDDKINYVPSTSYAGVDTFSYQICDADGDCSTATVTIDVLGIQPMAATGIAVTEISSTNPTSFTGNLTGLTGGSGNFTFKFEFSSNSGIVQAQFQSSSQNNFTFNASSDLCGLQITFSCTVVDNITNQEYQYIDTVAHSVLCN